jgi:hypothetical protein
MSDFDQLLDEINALAAEQSTLTKSMPAEGGDGDDEEEEEEEEKAPAAKGKGEGEGDESVAPADLKKSMVIDGENVEVVDAEQLVKSLNELADRVEGQDQMLVKSITPMLDLIKGQGALLKSMQGQLEKLSGQGRGRKTVLAIVEKPAPGEQPLRKSQPAQMAPAEILAKALDAQKAGKISGIDVARAENAIQSGTAIPADVLARI